MPSILFIRRKDDIFLSSFLENLDPKIFNCFILDLKSGEYIDVNGNVKRRLTKHSNNRYINYILRFVSGFVFLLKFGRRKFNVIHVLGIKRDNFWLLPFLKKSDNQIIITVYGRSTFTKYSKRILFSSIYKYAQWITFSNDSLIEEFLSHHKSVDRLKLINLVLPIRNFSQITYINDKRLKDDLYQKLDLNSELITVSCSSTASSYDQHYKVIAALKRLDKSIKNKIQPIFLISYGGTAGEKLALIERIKAELQDLEYKIFDKFLSDSDVGAYRMCTDIYINMRSTDQMAGAVLESIFAGAILISAKWLNYKTLDDIGVHYEKTTFEELPEVLTNSVIMLERGGNVYGAANSSVIKSYFHIDNVLEKWNLIFKNSSNVL